MILGIRWSLKPSEAQVVNAISKVVSVFHFHHNQILLKSVTNIYCFERISVGALIAQKTQFLVWKSNYKFVLSIGGFNQYPPQMLEGDCRHIHSDRGGAQHGSLRWVAEHLYL